MNTFIKKTNISFEAFYAKDYITSCSILKEAYTYLLNNEQKALPHPYYMEKGLTVIEELVQLPEIEPTEYLAEIISNERVALTNSGHLFNDRLSSISRIIGLLQDIETIVNYWDEFLGGMNNNKRPSITVGIESRGQFSFFENIYEKQTAKISE